MQVNLQLHKIEQWLHGAKMEVRTDVGKKRCNRGDGRCPHALIVGTVFRDTCVKAFQLYTFMM